MEGQQQRCRRELLQDTYQGFEITATDGPPVLWTK